MVADFQKIALRALAEKREQGDLGLALGVAFVLLQQKYGLIRMPGNYIINAYPVILKASDIIWTVVGVALVGYLIALLPSLTKTTDNQ